MGYLFPSYSSGELGQALFLGWCLAVWVIKLTLIRRLQRLLWEQEHGSSCCDHGLNTNTAFDFFLHCFIIEYEGQAEG
jgi:hypothetical protein